MSRAGYVLAGGASSRMGRDKALLDWKGRPLLVHLATIVQQSTGSATIVGAHEKYGHLGFSIVTDRDAGFGPLEGIRAALEHSGADWNLIIACDMPYLNPELLGGLLAAAELSDFDCLMPKGQPLCAVYHRRCLPAIEQALQNGVRKVREALNALDVGLYETAQVLCFQNMNYPDDLARAL